MLITKARMMTALAAILTLGSAQAAETADQTAEDTIVVTGRFLSIDRLNAVKTPTPVLNVPQSLSIVPRAQIEDQGFTSIADILRYMPGLAVSQGEGHRDAIIIRGNQSTADFFLDGLRDDVQYYRPLYNLEQVEVLRGANALLFGRGGGGGVVNRVTKTGQLDEDFASLNASVDTFGAHQVAGDVNSVLSDTVAFRVNAFAEHMDNHRDVFEGDRFAINPTFTVELAPQTQLFLSYEYVNDDRVVDRGVPSVSVANGPDVPLEGFRDTFFGVADGNYTTLEASIFRSRLEHTFSENLRGNVTVQYADYDKYYQNIYPAGLDTSVSPQQLTLDGYADETGRENFIAQGNLVGEFDMGPFRHTVLLGVEYGDQSTSNARIDNTFAASNDDQITIDFTTPISVPDYAFVDTLRDRDSDVQFTSLYLQDQIDLTEQLKLVLGLRFDRFDVSVLDREAVSPTDDGRRARVDEEVSPRLGLIYKPAENVSVYASYAESFLPSAGDQFLTLTRTTEDVQPQRFENTEVGLKWDFSRNLSLTTALFRVERGLFTSVDPNNVSQVITIPGSVTDGFEAQLTGQLADAWTVTAGYSYLDSTVDGGSFDGNRTLQTPEHMLSIWNEYQATDQLALALGVTYQDSYFVREDNAVEVPDFTRVDAAVFYDLSDQTRLQLNVENLLDEDYFPDAHSNDNISTGKPLNARLTIRHRF
ncbi:TonB-dependent siderophore receptor [Oceanicaulis sp. MMSF_3324]|uniref:TonB-dependent receptor n=1 Tax=Oceanicaulis sp. MMSF_3324 TaxID=3046702 RepID=UPI00273F32BF|nr:TonB-dependent siderophore receptor [Oceanicaulis sp. MMSF_3324]